MNSTCTVVFGTITAYLNPTNSDTQSQQDAVEQSVLYEMMSLMRSGILEKDLTSLEHARYLSPIVVMPDEHYGLHNPSQSSYQGTNGVGMTVTQSILIIAACVAIIGSAGLILSIKGIFRNDDDYMNREEDEGRIPRWSRRGNHVLGGRRKSVQQVVVSDKIHQQTEEGDVAASLDVNDIDLSRNSARLNGESRSSSNRMDEEDLDVLTAGRASQQSHTGDDWGTSASMTTTMRRAIITKKVPVVKAANLGLGAVIEEDDDEDVPSPKSVQ